MSEPGPTADVPSSPSAPQPERRRSRAVTIAVVVAGVIAAGATLVGGAFALLYVFNPLGDEWQCSDGEAPAGEAPYYNQCFRTDAELPAGYSWDPFGNRPMPYNCDKRGWMRIERTVTPPQGQPYVEDDCVRTDTDLPAGWRRASGD